MRARTLILIALFIGVVLGGCLSPGEDSSDGPNDGSEPGAAPRYLPPISEGLELPNVTYPNYQALDCDTLSLGTVVPIDLVEPVIPDAFAVQSSQTPFTTTVTLEIHNCEQMLDHSLIHGAGNLMLVYVSVTPVNESWKESGTLDFYLLDPSTDNEDLMTAFQDVFFDVETASFSIERESLIDDIFIMSYGIETTSWSIDFDYRYLPNDPQDLGHETILWYGDGPFHRFHETTSYVSTARGDTTSGNLLHLEGDSSIATVLPTNLYPYRAGSWRAQMNTLYQYQGAWGVEEYDS